MELELTEDQEFFVATTRRFLAAEAPVSWVRTLEDDPAGFTPDYWRAGAALGWTSLLVPEADGGGSVSGSGLADLVLVAEEMGRLVSPGPLVPVNVVAAAVATGGSPDHRDAVLPGLLDGSAVAAWTGPREVGAEATAGGYRLSGVASPVEAGAQADHLLVSAAGPDGALLLLVDPHDPGVTVAPLGGLDLVRRHAEVRLDGVDVPATAVVDADPGHLARLACAIQCAESVGVMDRVFEMTREWLADRWSFGRPLASYQALKHRMADGKTVLEASHAVAVAAARAVAAGTPDAAALVSAAKAWIGRQSTELIQDCIQLHGGIGVTWEHDLHLYLRRATVNRLTYGTPEEHADRIAACALEEAS